MPRSASPRTLLSHARVDTSSPGARAGAVGTALLGAGLVGAAVIGSGCSPAPTGGTPLRAPSHDDARRVVTEFIDALRRGDARSTSSRLCPAEAAAVADVVGPLLRGAQAPTVEDAEPAWSNDVPLFLVQVLSQDGATATRRHVVVRAREGCVSDVVDFEAKHKASPSASPQQAPGDTDLRRLDGGPLPISDEIEL